MWASIFVYRYLIIIVFEGIVQYLKIFYFTWVNSVQTSHLLLSHLILGPMSISSSITVILHFDWALPTLILTWDTAAPDIFICICKHKITSWKIWYKQLQIAGYIIFIILALHVFCALACDSYHFDGLYLVFQGRWWACWPKEISWRPLSTKMCKSSIWIPGNVWIS